MRCRATLFAFLAVVTLHLQAQGPVRPRITGISHVGYFVSDLPRALTFWHDLLGFDQSYDLKKPGTDQVRIAFIKINDHQHVELFNEPPTSPPSFMSHLCFTVDDAEAMRTYLRAHGFDIAPGNSAKTRTGDYAFEVKDPDGNLVEFVQSLPTGLERQAAGRFTPPRRIAGDIYHLGFLVADSARSIAFYQGLLGFHETWRGGPTPTELAWINLQVPDGTDYIELMLYSKLPATYGGKNHISLLVPDVAKAIAELESRPAYTLYGQPLTLQTGRNGKRQVNLFDPDGTRVELMEAHTANGQPVPSSTAPPPTHK